MRERPNRQHWKCCDLHRSVGSNPTSSATTEPRTELGPGFCHVSHTSLAPSPAALTVEDVLKMVQHAMFHEDEVLRDTGMLCVVCHETLRDDRFGMLCRSCGSRWWHLGRLERAGHGELSHALRIAASPMECPPLGRPCPSCASRMSVVRSPAYERAGVPGDSQRVDVCLECDVVWLDPHELDELV